MSRSRCAADPPRPRCGRRAERPALRAASGRPPPGSDDVFLAAWEQTRVFLRGQPGYLATRLHRSLSPDAEFRFVDLGRYASPQAFQAAVGQPEFRQAAAAIQHRAHPSLYLRVRR